ncbi:GLEYA domain-containing protein [Xylogone sp. PMI_703]|nr:GLEYA domain-containing protein [Xylogone sp. PMI_703]
MRSVAAFALLSAYSAAALPTEAGHQVRPLPLVCLIVDTVVTALHAAPSASPFCSSFLGIKTSTAYTTTTSTSYITSIVSTVTGTDTITAPTLTLPTVTLPTVTAATTTITETADAVSVTACLSSSVLEKRHLPTTTKKTVPGVPTPDCLKNLLPSAVSLACSCLNVPTPTSTSTVTQTLFPTTIVTTDIAATAVVTPLETPYYTPVVTPSTSVTVTPTSTVNYCPSPTPDNSCNNQGVQFAYYPNPFGGNYDGDYTQFDPTYFKTDAPAISGVAGSAGGISGGCPYASSTFNFYGYTENCNYIALNYRGYLYAGQSGTFTFRVFSADDIVLIWAGPDAYAGWTRSNALIGITYPELGAGGGGGGSVSASYTAVAGEYIPLRILFAQGDGPFGFNIEITAPDGSIILSASSSTSEYLVQFSCDGTTAPPYAPFGAEP